ncbi:MAG: hypothetical protein U0518_01885 [Candidatus Gracilibacteria bacterium]
MSKSLSTQTLLDFIEQIPEEQNVFLVDFCRAIQIRKQQIIDESISSLILLQSTNQQNEVSNTLNNKQLIQKMVKALLGDGFEIRQIDAKANTTIDLLALTKKRKNKYGLEMTDLEQELDDIKLGLNGKDIEKYQGARYEHPEHGKEDAVEFFNRVYGKYKQDNCIFQDDLLAIDQKLYRSLVNLLDRKGVKDKRYDYSLAELLPTSSHRVALIQGKVAKSKEQELSYFASRLKSIAV